MHNKIKAVIELCKKENPCEIDVKFDEPMSEHTTFRTGGPADCLLRPDGEGFTAFCSALIYHARKENIPFFVLGGGANLLVSDKGIRGIVLDMKAWDGESVWALFANEDQLVLKGGTSIDEAVDTAVSASLEGLEFLAGMPGTIGGAVWMNARCYSREIADVLVWVEVITKDEKGEYTIKRIDIVQKEGFGYKQSPFQEMDCLILSAALQLKKGDKDKILLEMEKNRQDRQEKGHYNFPCAGSAFKNNRDFGKPTGVIIDELGLKGLKIGGAQIAPFHGNIIINTGGASSADIRALMDKVASTVKAATGFTLESEILYAGDW
jgi:UDP-N-acetylmuramate dehydrogenase